MNQVLLRCVPKDPGAHGRQGVLLRLKGCKVVTAVEGAPHTVEVPLSAGVAAHQAAGDFPAALKVCRA